MQTIVFKGIMKIQSLCISKSKIQEKYRNPTKQILNHKIHWLFDHQKKNYLPIAFIQLRKTNKKYIQSTNTKNFDSKKPLLQIHNRLE